MAAGTCLRDVKEPTRTDHLTATAAHWAGDSTRTRLRAASVAFIARIKLLNLNCLLCAKSRFLQFDFHVVPQIRTPMTIVCADARAAAEERLKNSAAKSAAAEHFAKNLERIMETAACKSGTTLGKRGVTEAIVRGAFLLIHENVVRFPQFLEFFLGVGVIRVFVRMKFYGEFAIGAFDFLIRGSSFHAEDFIIIAFVGSHGVMSPL